MRITDLYDLEHDKQVRRKVKETLFDDLVALAKCKFKHNEFRKFMIKLAVIEISPYK